MVVKILNFILNKFRKKKIEKEPKNKDYLIHGAYLKDQNIIVPIDRLFDYTLSFTTTEYYRLSGYKCFIMTEEKNNFYMASIPSMNEDFNVVTVKVHKDCLYKVLDTVNIVDKDKTKDNERIEF